MGKLIPGNLTGSLKLGTPVPKMCRNGFVKSNRVYSHYEIKQFKSKANSLNGLTWANLGQLNPLPVHLRFEQVQPKIWAWRTPMKAKNWIGPPELKTNLSLLEIIFSGNSLWKNFELSYFLERLKAVRAFDLIPRLRARPKHQLSSGTKFPYVPLLYLVWLRFFVFINHFWLCAAVVTQCQPVSKWLRP